MPEPVRLIERPAMRLAGIREEHAEERLTSRAPFQWARLMGASPLVGQRGHIGYGVRDPHQIGLPHLHYTAAVEIDADAPIPDGMIVIDVPPACYAAFDMIDQTSEMRRAWHAIVSDWLPASGHAIAPLPALERFGEQFDPMLGRGDITLWLPVRAVTG